MRRCAFLIALVLLAGTAAGIRAQETIDIRPGTEADSAAVRDTTGTAADTSGARRGPVLPGRPWYLQPKWIMLRSVAVPGWGQWTNGKHLKAILFAAGEGYLAWRAVDWGLKERDAKRLARAHRDDPAEEAVYSFNADHAAQRRRDFTWWTVFAAVFSMGDAYVDAQLGDFNSEFEPQDTDTQGGKSHSPALRVGVGIRLP